MTDDKMNENDESNTGSDDSGSDGSTGIPGLKKDNNQTFYETIQSLVDNSEYGSGPLVNQIVELHKKVGIVKKVLERILLEKLGKWRKSKNHSEAQAKEKKENESKNKFSK